MIEEALRGGLEVLHEGLHALADSAEAARGLRRLGRRVEVVVVDDRCSVEAARGLCRTVGWVGVHLVDVTKQEQTVLDVLLQPLDGAPVLPRDGVVAFWGLCRLLELLLLEHQVDPVAVLAGEATHQPLKVGVELVGGAVDDGAVGHVAVLQRGSEECVLAEQLLEQALVRAHDGPAVCLSEWVAALDPLVQRVELTLARLLAHQHQGLVDGGVVQLEAAEGVLLDALQHLVDLGGSGRRRSAPHLHLVRHLLPHAGQVRVEEVAGPGASGVMVEDHGAEDVEDGRSVRVAEAAGEAELPHRGVAHDALSQGVAHGSESRVER